MRYDFNKLLTEIDFAEIVAKVKNFEIFEFFRADKTNKIELRIGTRHCANNTWANDYYCYIDGENRKLLQGFGSPYQRARFLELTYDNVSHEFEQLGLEINREYKQLSLFNLL